MLTPSDLDGWTVTPTRDYRLIMFRILSAVLRLSIPRGRTKVVAGAWRIECVELSRTGIYGD